MDFIIKQFIEVSRPSLNWIDLFGVIQKKDDISTGREAYVKLKLSLQYEDLQHVNILWICDINHNFVPHNWKTYTVRCIFRHKNNEILH